MGHNKASSKTEIVIFFAYPPTAFELHFICASDANLIATLSGSTRPLMRQLISEPAAFIISRPKRLDGVVQAVSLPLVESASRQSCVCVWGVIISGNHYSGVQKGQDKYLAAIARMGRDKPEIFLLPASPREVLSSGAPSADLLCPLNRKTASGHSRQPHRLECHVLDFEL